jgi:hypothetical protein
MVGALAPLSDTTAADASSSLPRFVPLLAPFASFEITIGDACPIRLGDAVVGSIGDPPREDAYSFHAPGGTLLDLEVKALGSPVPLDLALFDPQLRPIDLDSALRVKRGASRAKKILLRESGLYQIVLGPGAAGGEYLLKLRGRVPRDGLSLKSSHAVEVAEESFEETFFGTEGSVLQASLRGEGTSPEFVELIDPQGSPIPLGGGALVPGPRVARIQGLVLPASGVLRLRFRGRTPGTLDLSIRLLLPRGRNLEECGG